MDIANPNTGSIESEQAPVTESLRQRVVRIGRVAIASFGAVGALFGGLVACSAQQTPEQSGLGIDLDGGELEEDEGGEPIGEPALLPMSGGLESLQQIPQSEIASVLQRSQEAEQEHRLWQGTVTGALEDQDGRTVFAVFNSPITLLIDDEAYFAAWGEDNQPITLPYGSVNPTPTGGQVLEYDPGVMDVLIFRDESDGTSDGGPSTSLPIAYVDANGKPHFTPVDGQDTVPTVSFFDSASDAAEATSGTVVNYSTENGYEA